MIVLVILDDIGDVGNADDCDIIGDEVRSFLTEMMLIMLVIFDWVGDVGDADDIGKGCPNYRSCSFF